MDSETIFAILVGAALACFGLAMVGYSFFRRTEPENPVLGSLPASTDGVGLDSLLDSVDTLELEYQLGKVPEVQYLQQLQSYRLQIAAMVRDQLENGAALPELILEQEVQLARSRMNDASLSGSLEVETPSAVSYPQCDDSLDEASVSPDSEKVQPAQNEGSGTP